MALITSPNMAQPDEIYAALLRQHNGLTVEESAAFNARLILLLANHIGDHDVLMDALAAAGSR